MEENNEKNETNTERRIKRIKKHIKDNREFYTMTAAQVATGALGVLVLCVRAGQMNKLATQAVSTGSNSPVIVGNSNVLQQTISPYGNKLGHPGNPVFDTTSRKRYASETLTAKHLGVSLDKLRKHLDGRSPHVNNHQLVRLNGLDDWDLRSLEATFPMR